MRESRLRLRERGPLVRRHAERGELAPARLKRFTLRRGGQSRRRRGFAFLHGGVPGSPRVRDRARERGKPSVRIDERALHFGDDERLVRVLAMQVDELFAQILQLRERRGAAVDPGAAPSLRVERAAQQHLAVGRAEVVRGEPVGDRRTIFHFEDRGELRALRTRPKLAKLEAIAEQQRESVEQDRLAGAGLPGQHREGIAELEVERVDDDEIANGQQAEHRGALSLGGPFALMDMV